MCTCMYDTCSVDDNQSSQHKQTHCKLLSDNKNIGLINNCSVQCFHLQVHVPCKSVTYNKNKSFNPPYTMYRI